MNKRTLILLTASLIGTQAWSGSVTVPNTFSDGTTASASEVNANFNALSGAINDNDVRVTANVNDINNLKQQITELQVKLELIKTVYVKSNNTIIGVHTGHSGSGSPVVEFINDQGYLVNISSGGNLVAEGTLLPVGNQGNLTYESTNCQGQAYIFLGYK